MSTDSITEDGAPLGRRERKKIRTRIDLLKAARRLFGKHGYEATSIDQIAGAADVAVGTVYNYFPTKMHLLIELFESAIGETVKADHDLIANPPADCVAAVHRLAMTFLSDFGAFDRTLLRQLQAGILQDVGSFGPRTIAVLELMTDQIEAMLDSFVARGKLKTANTKTLARLLFNLVNAEYFAWISSETTTMDTVSRSLRAQYGVVLKGLLRH